MTAIFMSMHFTGVKGVGRPAECQPNTTGTVFKLVRAGSTRYEFRLNLAYQYATVLDP